MSTGERQAVAVRLEAEVLAEVEQLRGEHPTATGDPTTRSDVLRLLVNLGLAAARRKTAKKAAP